MLKPSILLLSAAMLFCLHSFAQLTLNGTNTPNSTFINASAVIVDDGIIIAGTASIDGAKAYISTNFTSGDVLGFSNAALPSGVTGNYGAATGVLTFTGTASPAAYQALLRTVTYNTTSTNFLTRTILFNLGTATSFSGNNHFYEFIPGTFTWSDAYTAANARTYYGLQGYLTTITSQAENDFIQQKLSSDGWIGSSDDYIYINLATGVTTYTSQPQSEARWYWVTGPEKGQQFSLYNGNPVAIGGSFINWNINEPNNGGGNENYGEIYSTAATGKWNDLPNSYQLGYTVEYGGTPGDPVVDLTHSRDISIGTSIQGATTTMNYTLQMPAVIVDTTVSVYSAANIIDARVTISGNFQSGDVLAFNSASLPSGVTGSYDAATGVLSFTGSSTPAELQALLRTVTFNSTSASIANRTATFSLGNAPAFANGHFYAFLPTAMTWPAAVADAQTRTYMGMTGYLATITSQAENDFIQQKLSADGWIGASDDYTYINAATGVTTYNTQAAAEGNWYWVAGPEAGQQFSAGNFTPVAVAGQYINWNIAEPNNTSPDENYGEIFSSGSSATAGKWNDFGTQSLGYVVEYGGLASDPSNILSDNRVITIAAALPLTGLHLEANKNGEGTRLTWSTLTEANTDRFDILHSANGRDFSKAGEVKAAGNSQAKQYYSWVHPTHTAGTNYYRLQQFDKDAHATFSPVVQVVFDRAGVHVFPNPVVNEVNITYPYSGNKTVLQILNAKGELVLTKSITGEQTKIGLQHLPSGVYVAQITEEGVSTKIQFVKRQR